MHTFKYHKPSTLAAAQGVGLALIVTAVLEEEQSGTGLQ